MAKISEILVDLQNRIAELERKRRNARRTGIIEAIDTRKGLARVNLVDGEKKFITGWIPWKEIAAGLTSTHIPPVVGQQVDVLSENGDLTDAVIDFSIHSQKNKRPHDGAQMVIVHGATRVTLDESTTTIETANEIKISCANIITLSTRDTHITGNLSVDGNLVTKGNSETSGNVDYRGGYVRHNGKNIGDTHKHLGVRSGGDVTDVPE